jgi:hypothetical protein
VVAAGFALAATAAPGRARRSSADSARNDMDLTRSLWNENMEISFLGL